MVESPGTGSTSPTPKNFRLNPLEAVVFAAVFGVFGTSIYRLFDDHSDASMATVSLHATAERMQKERLASEPVDEPVEAVPEVFQAAIAALNIDCRDGANLETSADRVRLGGTFCAGAGDRGPASADGDSSRTTGLRTVIVNRANGFTATLFELPASGQFLTDYIPLEAGENRVFFEFHPRNGKSVSFERMIVRKPSSATQ